MSIIEPLCDSDDSISWHAHREAEKLNDITLIEELASYVRQEPKQKRRDNAYFIIAKIGINTSPIYSAKILIEFVAKETDKNILGGLISRLSEFDRPMDIDWEPVFPHLRDPRWLVRHTAICALRCCPTTKGEQEVLKILNSSTERYELVYCCSTLSYIGSMNAISSLEKTLASRSRDVKHSAKYAIETIMSRHSDQS